MININGALTLNVINAMHNKTTVAIKYFAISIVFFEKHNITDVRIIDIEVAAKIIDFICS